MLNLLWIFQHICMPDMDINWEPKEPACISDTLQLVPLYIIPGSRLCVQSWHGSLSIWPRVLCVYVHMWVWRWYSYIKVLLAQAVCEVSGSQAACRLAVGLSPPGCGWHSFSQKLLKHNKKQEKKNCVTHGPRFIRFEVVLACVGVHPSTGLLHQLLFVLSHASGL